MSLFGPNKADLENANWVLRDRLGKPNQSDSGWPTSLPRTQEEFNKLIADAKLVVEANKGKYLPTEISEFEQLLAEYYDRTPGAKLVKLRTETTNGAIPKDTEPVISNERDSTVSPNLTVLKTTLEKEANSPMTVASLTQLLQSLETEKDPLARAMIMNMAWSRLSSQGYIMLIQRGNILLENPSNPQDAVSLAATLNNHLSAKKFQLAEIQSAVMTGTGRFGSYVETQSANPKESSLVGYVLFLTETLKISLSKNPKTDEIAIQNHPTATPAEKAFLISYISGGYAGYNAIPDVERKIALKKQDIELRSSTAFVATEKVVDKASDGALTKEKELLKKEGKTEELTLDTFMDNPTLAISKYPWTSLTLLIGSIYQFGFMKTIGGLLVGMVGIKALNEIGTETGLGKEIKDGLKRGAKSAGVAATEALEKAGKVADETYDKGKAAVDDAMKPAEIIPEKKSVLTPSQELAQKEVMKESSKFNTMIQSHTKAVPNQNASLDDYIKFLQSSGFQNQKLDNILYSQNAKASIFQNEKNWDLTIRIPGNMDPVILKKIFRQYLTGSYLFDTAPEGSQEGDKERSAFEKKYALSINEKGKSIQDTLPNIYK